MERTRSKFAGGDQRYLRDEQYADPTRLAQRANLHARWGTGPVPWFEWVASHVDLAAGSRVLEAGCGAGWLWEAAGIAVPAGVTLTLSDLSIGMVQAAVDRVRPLGRFAEVRGVVADLQHLPEADGSFDRVVANHMLYHLPDPESGVRELARIVDPDGTVVVATNGRRHLQEVWRIRGEVFDEAAVDRTIDVFGVETGFPILRDHFDDVRWVRFEDELRCRAAGDVVAFICSTPPGETASETQHRQLVEAVERAFRSGEGELRITKDTGCFVCRRPRR